MAIIKKGTKVKLTLSLVDLIKTHAEESWQDYYNPTNRSEWQVKSDIIRGKIGEFGYYIMCVKAGYKQITLPDLENHKEGGDGGVDLIQNNITVDVKSLDEENSGHFKTIMNSKLPAEAYVLCWVNVNDRTVTYEGAITTKTIIEKNLLMKDINKQGLPYYYVNKRYLGELDEFFKPIFPQI